MTQRHGYLRFCPASCPAWYKRKIITTEYGEAWAYYLNRVDKACPVVESGDWMGYVDTIGVGIDLENQKGTLW